MRKFILPAVLFLFALSAFGHAGEVHKYMGTVTTLNEDGSFRIETTDGRGLNVAVSKETTYQQADGQPAKATDLAEGKRVVVTVGTDGKTATLVKLARQ